MPRIGFDQPHWLLLLLAVPVVLLLAWPRLRTMGRWRRRGALFFRALILLLVVLALARPSVRWPDDSLSVAILVDESESTSGAFRAAAQAWLEDARRAADSNDRVTVIRFGREAAVDGGEGVPPPAVDATATNLEAAIRLADSLLSPSGGRRIVVLSDGWENVGAAQDALTQAVRPGTEISFATPGLGPTAAEVAIRALEAPPTVRDGAAFEVVAVIDTVSATDATLRLSLDGRALSDQPVKLEPGTNRFALPQRARSPGFRRLRVEVNAAADTRPDNNAAEATTVVKEAGRVLLLEGRPGEASELGQLLADGGLEVEVLAPSAIPPRAEPLERFDSIGLVNVAATQFTLDQQRTIQQYVQNLGRGLFVAGGNTSYALGGYAGTVLEELLPVSPQPPPRRDEGSVALFLVIDRSGSMDLTRSDVSKMAMAREAAILATEALRPGDTLGVLTFEIRFAWAVPPTVIRSSNDIREAQSRIAGIRADGGTSIFPALEEAYKAASQSNAKLKHIILLTDGQSFDSDYAGLIDRMKPFQITLSTIAVGSDSDTKLLTTLAQLGTGRYYFTERAQDVPKITSKETTIVTRSALVEGQVAPRLVEPSPVLIGLTGGELPMLGGYVATSTRGRASTILASDQGDPLLAHWQYGLGRVVAWTSDADGNWSADWLSWPNAAQFWQQAVRWTMPEPIQPGFQVAATVIGDQVSLRVHSARPDGRLADLLDTRVTVVAPNGEARELVLPQVGPGTYQVTTTAPTPGAYEARFAQYENGRATRGETVGFSVLGAAESRSVGVNRSLLGRLAGRTGGHELAGPADAFARDFAPHGERGYPLWPWLVGAALMLFPFDVAIRRLRLVRQWA